MMMSMIMATHTKIVIAFHHPQVGNISRFLAQIIYNSNIKNMKISFREVEYHD